MNTVYRSEMGGKEWLVSNLGYVIPVHKTVEYRTADAKSVPSRATQGCQGLPGCS